MSEPAVRAELQITFKDSATAGMKAVAAEAEKAASKTAAASIAAANKSLAATEQLVSKSRSAYQKLASARETLGIRPEQEIQREIQQTEAAYNRLARSGAASARELQRAQDASIAKVKALRHEMGEAQKSFKLTPGAVAGVAGAYMLAKPAVTRAMDYDHTVAALTNTMFNDRDKAGRIAGKEEIKQAISDALKVGGGTREQAAGTLSALMGSGEFTKEQSYGLLKMIQKGSTATGADSGQLADIVLAAKRMGIKPEDMDKVISKAIRAGELGGFELSDMAKHLPAALSSARSLGLSGMGGFERVLASMQSSVLTAGTKDEAANNLINILEKMNSSDTAKDFQKQGINLRGELVKGANRGEDTITTFTKLIDQVIAKDPNTKAVTQELDRLSKIAEDKKNPQREQALKQIQQIYASSEIGKFLQDRQALQGFRAESQGGKSGLTKAVREGLARDDNAQELNTSYAVMDDTASAQMQKMENAKLEGQDKALTGVGGPLKPLLHGITSAAQEFPLLTASVSAATSALGLLAGAAGINAVLGVGGKGALLGRLGTLASSVAPRVATAAAGLFSTPVAVGAGALAGGFALGQTDTAGELVLNVMKFFGSKDAKMALETLKQPEAQAPKMKADLNVSVTDDRVVVKRTNLQANGVDATMNTGHIMTGAM